ncbi:NACHT, LRR and PYD domains-containing protein 3 [Nowakowskiella sp. JEL0407]|nr:NACHT, LRR and PYD domains-containing protein 3 [Nowakowskiella sp. JEL0407]
MPGKKKVGEGKKGKGSAKKRKEGELEAAKEQLINELKSLRTLYQQQCENFITEPLLEVNTRINKAITTGDAIEKIIISSISVTVSNMYALTTTFQTYQTLNTIYLGLVILDERCLDALEKFFYSHPTINTLHLIDCGITSKMSSHIAGIARNSKTITTLILDHNPIQSSGIIQIFHGIRENKHGSLLRKCSFRFCDITADCGEHVASTLAVNISILELDLTGNQIGNIGLIPIARALSSNQTLKLLNLSSNLISDKYPADYIIEMTKLLPTLQSSANRQANALTGNVGSFVNIDVSQRDAVDALSILCSVVATQNTGLAELDLRGNHCGNLGGECVLEMMKARKLAVSTKKAEPLVTYVTERISQELFEKIWELNVAMKELNKKKGKSKDKGKGKGKKKKVKNG